MTNRKERRLTLYRDDSTAQVVYDRVKTHFFTANNTVLTISRYDGETGSGHHYIHWPRERFCWFRDEPKPEREAAIDLHTNAIYEAMRVVEWTKDDISSTLREQPAVANAVNNLLDAVQVRIAEIKPDAECLAAIRQRSTPCA